MLHRAGIAHAHRASCPWCFGHSAPYPWQFEVFGLPLDDGTTDPESSGHVLASPCVGVAAPAMRILTLLSQHEHFMHYYCAVRMRLACPLVFMPGCAAAPHYLPQPPVAVFSDATVVAAAVATPKCPCDALQRDMHTTTFCTAYSN